MTASEHPGEGPAPEETAVPAQSNAPDVAAAAVDGKQAIVLDGAPAPDEASAPGDATAPAPEQMTPLTSEEAPPATSSTGQPVLPGHGRHEAAPAPPLSAWQTLGKALRPRLTMSQLVAALLCGLLGFALAVQLTADERSSLAGLRQNELVRILDEVTRRGEDLEQQAQTLRGQLAELRSSTDDRAAAIDLALARAEVQGILSGRLPAEGPGVIVRIDEGDTALPGTTMLSVLQELRNAGAEVIELNDVRIVASSAFTDTPQGLMLDGTLLSSPYVWHVIGSADTLTPALEIPGGAMASVRNAGGKGTVTAQKDIRIDAVREPSAQRFATPVAPDQ